MRVEQLPNGDWEVQPLDGPSDVMPVLTIPQGTNVHVAWQQVLAFCAQNGIRVIPQMVLINPSGTTGTVIS